MSRAHWRDLRLAVLYLGYLATATMLLIWYAHRNMPPVSRVEAGTTAAYMADAARTQYMPPEAERVLSALYNKQIPLTSDVIKVLGYIHAVRLPGDTDEEYAVKEQRKDAEIDDLVLHLEGK